MNSVCIPRFSARMSHMSKDVLKFEDLSETHRKALEQFIKEAGGLEAAQEALDALAEIKSKAA